MIKKLTLLLILTLTLTACSLFDSKEEQPVPPPPEPLVGQVFLGERGQHFVPGPLALVSLETLEQTFMFYSAYDKEANILSVVKDHEQVLLSLEQGVLIQRGTKAKWGPAEFIEGSLHVTSSTFMQALGYQVYEDKGSRLVETVKKNSRVIIKQNGPVYTDESFTHINQATPQEGIWVTDIPGGVLMFDEDLNLLAVPDHQMTQSIPVSRSLEVMEVTDPLVIAWDLYGNQSQQVFNESIDVVIPKWLNITNGQGDINTLYRPIYHQNALDQGKAVWVLVNNAFDPDLTHDLLNHFAHRQTFIKQITTYALTHGLTGINMDFENMYLKDQDLYLQLVAELAVVTKANDLVLSVAVTVPGGSDNWSLVYDRTRLAEVSDLITLMSYDQYWASSPVAGPVAGFSWVEGHVEDLIKTIPAHKLALGLPFYTRVWYERFSEDIPNKMNVTSKSVFMASPQTLITDHNPVKVWDQVHGQYYYAYMDEGRIVKFWYDDEAALAKKAGLVRTYKLAGIACWSLGFERDTVWEALEKALEE